MKATSSPLRLRTTSIFRQRALFWLARWRRCISRRTTGLLKDKSTYARCGIWFRTPSLEAGWQGVPTLELVNHLDRPVRLHVGQGIGQMLFFRGEPCEVSYEDRGGKYQGQTGVTLAKVLATPPHTP